MNKYSREELEQQIKNTRSMSPDGSKVTYDLTMGVDFSNPRMTAEVLGEVFFKNDVSTWFHRENDQLNFDPKYRGEILVTDQNEKKVSETVKDFFKDLEKDDLRSAYSEEIRSAGTYHAGLTTFMFAGLLGSLLIQSNVRHHQEKEYMMNLMNQITGNIDIRSMSGT